MLELLPRENIDFVQAETKRINEFGQEHFDGHGFTDITRIAEKPFKTAEKLINISEVAHLMAEVGLRKIDQFHMLGVGLLKGERAPLGFGTNKFAILCATRNDLLTDISLRGCPEDDDEKQKLIDILLLLGQTFSFFAVNWHSCEHYNLIERSSVEKFIASI